MEYKKKKPTIYHTPFGSTTIPPYPEIDLSPYTIETTSLGDSRKSYTVSFPSGHTTLYDELIKGEDTMVNIKCEHTFEGEYRVICKDKDDLSLKNILTTISAVKGRLMLETAPVRVESLECKITPTIRHNIITASKKLNMYGKDMPIVARFDDFGNRLPDTISINDTKGVLLKVVDPKDYGEFYFELTAIVPSSFEFTPSYDGLPFYKFRK